jgi:hypothetical protein
MLVSLGSPRDLLRVGTDGREARAIDAEEIDRGGGRLHALGFGFDVGHSGGDLRDCVQRIFDCRGCSFIETGFAIEQRGKQSFEIMRAMFDLGPADGTGRALQRMNAPKHILKIRGLPASGNVETVPHDRQMLAIFRIKGGEQLCLDILHRTAPLSNANTTAMLCKSQRSMPGFIPLLPHTR